jgi:hypothetical protein
MNTLKRRASGAFLDGGWNYGFDLPPNIPVGAFWPVVVYDALSRSDFDAAYRRRS